jgi:DNA repair exonuclease SbcCD ATPase subunit
LPLYWGNRKTKIKVKNVEIKAFRGIPDLSLELAGNSLILKGENGTGKSSIVEAFEFFFTGKLSGFEGEGTKSLSLLKHAPHRNFDKEDVSIKMSFDPGDIVLERNFSDNPKIPKELKDYFEVAKKGTFILRRAQILKFIASVPADRFRAIASILGIERLDNIELEMKRAYEELDSTVSSGQDRIKSIYNEISTLLEEQVEKKELVLKSINKKLKEAKLDILTSFEDVGKIDEQLVKTFNKATDIEQLTKLNQILGEIKLLKIDSNLSASLEDLNNKLKPLLKEKSQREIALTEFLAKGLQAVKDSKTNQCPLCGQEISRTELMKQINQRLQTLNQLSKEAEEIRQISTKLEEKLSALIKKLETICSEIEPFDDFVNTRKGLLEVLAFVGRVVDQVKSAKNFQEEIVVDDFENNMDKIKESSKFLTDTSQELLKNMNVPKDWKAKIKVIGLVNQVKSLITELVKVESSLETTKKHCGIAKKVYDTFSKVKKAKINEIYEAITGNVNAYYAMLHPTDPHKNIELNVALGKRASAELKIESFGLKEDPRAFASEGHLDSLGLCIVLAFVKKFNEPCNLVILDDVVTTIDAKHRGKICKLLFEHFGDYQLVITTHDSIWYDQLRAYQIAYKQESRFKNMEIVGWTLDDGPLIEPFKPRQDRIVDRLKKGDKHGAAAEGRLYLEWLLKKIIITTKAKVLLKTDRYTVSDLFSPAKNRISRLLTDGDYKKETLARFQELESTAIFGNLLLHDNPEAENASIEEVKQFCESVINLHESFSCPDCGQFLNYYQDMKRIRCNNPKCKQAVEVFCK